MRILGQALFILAGCAYINLFIHEVVRMYHHWRQYPASLTTLIILSSVLVFLLALYVLIIHDHSRFLYKKACELTDSLRNCRHTIKILNEENENLEDKIEHLQFLTDKIFSFLDGTADSSTITFRRKTLGENYKLKLRRGHCCVHIDDGAFIQRSPSVEQLVNTLHAIVVKFLSELTVMLANDSNDEDRMLMLATISMQLIDLRNRAMPVSQNGKEYAHKPLLRLAEALGSVAKDRDVSKRRKAHSDRDKYRILSDLLGVLHRSNHTEASLGFAIAQTLDTEDLIAFVRDLQEPTEKEFLVATLTGPKDNETDLPTAFSNIVNAFNQSDR